MKKVFTLLFCLILTMTGFVACNQTEEVHQHTFADEWRYDEAEHWHTATCEHVDEVADKGAHEDKDSNDICDVCGYIADHTHSFEDVWTQGEDTHYHKSACGHNVKKDETKHSDENNDGACDVCAYNGGHEHTYEEGWTALEDGHWHIPTCGHTVDGIGKEAHVDANNDGDCDVCAYNGGHEHTFADTWTMTDDEHWHEVTCGHSVAVADKSVHVDDDGDTTCDVCGYTPEHFHTFQDEWTGDATGHWHAASCGHSDVKKDESAHDGYEIDGVCDTCGFVVFRLFTITVHIPEYATITAPDGESVTTFIVRENTKTTIQVHIPTYAEIERIVGASVVGEPVITDDICTFTVEIDGVQADTEISVEAYRISAVDVIFTEGKGSLVLKEAFKYAYEDITFTAPSAGRYMIFSTSDEWVQFGIGEVDENGYEIATKVYFIDADAPGDYTVRARYFPWSVPESGLHEYSYTIAKVEESLTLKSLVSEGYVLPTNVDVTLYFTAPKAGRYQISSSTLGMAWNDYICNSIILEATEDNQVMSFTVRNEISSAASFSFDCTIVSMEPETVSVGEHTITALYGQYKAIVVIADQNGSFRIEAANPYFRFYIWNENTETMNSLGTSHNIEGMKVGDRFVLFLGLDTFDYTGTDDITDMVTVSYLGYIPPYENGGYTALTGTPNTYVSEYDASDFVLTAPAGAQISLDGETWQDSVEAHCALFGSITYWVKTTDGSTEVTVTVQRITYEFTLGLGTQVQAMIPGKDYTVYLTGSSDPAYYVNYILSWNHAHVTAFYNAVQIASGDTVNNYSSHYAMTITYTGPETADIAFTLEDPYVEEDTEDPVIPTDTTLTVGENAILVAVVGNYCEGTMVSFTAPTTATYVLSAAEGEENAGVYLISDNGDSAEMLEIPYEFTVEEGTVLYFNIITTDVMSANSDTIDLVVDTK